MKLQAILVLAVALLANMAVASNPNVKLAKRDGTPVSPSYAAPPSLQTPEEGP